MITVIIFISVLACVSARNDFLGGWDYFNDGTESDAVKVARINAQSAREIGEMNMKMAKLNTETEKMKQQSARDIGEMNMKMAKLTEKIKQQSALDIEWKRFRYDLCLTTVQYTIVFVMVTFFGVCIRDGLTGRMTDIEKFFRSLDPIKFFRYRHPQSS